MAKRDVVLVLLAAVVGLLAGVFGAFGYLSVFATELELESLSADQVSASRLRIENAAGSGFFFFVTEEGPQFSMRGKGGGFRGHAYQRPVLEMTDEDDSSARIRVEIGQDGEPQFMLIGKVSGKTLSLSPAD